MEDILNVIPDEDLPKLRDIYEQHLPYATHVFSLLNTCMRWKKMRPDKNYVTFFTMGEDWKTSGTFILLMQYSCYDLFVFTLEKSCVGLYRALTETKRIDWTRKILIYAVLEDHVPTTVKALSFLDRRIDHMGATRMWWMSKEKALQFTINCPEEVYLAKLNVSHSALVNKLWPHRYDGSEGYISTFIEMNGGYGAFLKSDGSLVAWVLKNHMGTLGILQTADGHQRKGYGALVTKALSKEIAEEGHNPLGTVVKGNVPSENLFRNLGFELMREHIFIELC